MPWLVLRQITYPESVKGSLSTVEIWNNIIKNEKKKVLKSDF